jgi:hypothetical protein
VRDSPRALAKPEASLLLPLAYSERPSRRDVANSGEDETAAAIADDTEKTGPRPSTSVDVEFNPTPLEDEEEDEDEECEDEDGLEPGTEPSVNLALLDCRLCIPPPPPPML